MHKKKTLISSIGHGKNREFHQCKKITDFFKQSFNKIDNFVNRLRKKKNLKFHQSVMEKILNFSNSGRKKNCEFHQAIAEINCKFRQMIVE